MRLNANCSTPHVLKLSRSEGISGSPVRLYVTMSEIVQPERVLNDCVGARVNEHGLLVHDRVSIFGDTVFGLRNDARALRGK